MSQASQDFVPNVASREPIVSIPPVRYGPVTAPAAVKNIRLQLLSTARRVAYHAQQMLQTTENPIAAVAEGK